MVSPSGRSGGTPRVQFNLGLIYLDGRGVLKDPVLAHMWFNIAGAIGSETAREFTGQS